MSAPRQEEADAAEIAFQIALARISAGATQDVLKIWSTTPQTGAKGAGWLNSIKSVVLGRRSVAHELAVAYYRLVRALRTGSTIQEPGKPKTSTVRLNELRQDFADKTREVAQQAPKLPPNVPKPTAPVNAPREYDPSDYEDDDDAALVEEIRSLERQIEESDREAERQLDEDLRNLNDQLARKARLLDDGKPANEVDAERSQLHDTAGARQAAISAMHAMNGARRTVQDVGNADKRVLGWVRRSRTGTPCGFCAMLISREVLYKSRKSALLESTGSDFEQYHPNCHCYALPIFSKTQYAGSDLFKLNRQYAEEWPEVTKGLSGKAALAAWRKYIRSQSKDGQVSSSTDTTQEA